MEQEDRDALTRVEIMVGDIKEMLTEKPSYPAIREKVITHGRILWPAILLTIGATIKSLWK